MWMDKKCPTCNNTMLLLLTSYICEACDIGETPVATEVEDSIDMITDFSSKGSIKPPLFTPTFSYQQIGGTGFYYDPEYARKNNVPGSDFQIGPIKDKMGIVSRYVFDKKDIQALLGWINMIPKNFNQNISGISFKYDNSIGTGRLEINKRWSFVAQGIDKIYKFFEPLVAP